MRGAVLFLFFCVFALCTAAKAEPRDIVIVEGDVNQLPGVTFPDRPWLDSRIAQLRAKGYRVHVVRGAEVATIREAVASPSTAAVIFFGHSSVGWGRRAITAFQAGEENVVNQKTERLASLAFGPPPDGDPSKKKIFVYACYGNNCTVSYEALKIDPKQVTSYDHAVLSVLQLGQLVYDEFEHALRPEGDLGKWVTALPSYRGNGASVDWVARDQWYHDHFWPKLVEGLRNAKDLSFEDIRAALNGNPPSQIKGEILDVAMKLVKGDFGFELIFNMARESGCAAWFLHRNLDRYLELIPREKRWENITRLLAQVPWWEDEGFLDVVEKALRAAPGREDVMGLFADYSLRYVDRGRYHKLLEMLKRIQPELAEKGVTHADFSRISAWLEAHDRGTCGFRHLIFRNFKTRNQLVAASPR